MKKVVYCFLFLALASNQLVAECKTPLNGGGKERTVASGEWRSLFKSDLSDAIYPKGSWFQDKDGVLSAEKDAMLWTKKKYGNFVLELDFKFGPGANSGVAFFSQNVAKWPWGAAEIQILDDAHRGFGNYPGNYRNGAIFARVSPRPGCSVPAGKWAHMKITARGMHVVAEINGKVSVDTDLSKFTNASVNPDGSRVPGFMGPVPLSRLQPRGHIGLQGKHGGVPVFFRSVKIREL